MNEFIKEVAHLKCEYPELTQELDIILDTVIKSIENEIFEGHIMIKKLLEANDTRK